MGKNSRNTWAILRFMARAAIIPGATSRPNDLMVTPIHPMTEISLVDIGARRQSPDDCGGDQWQESESEEYRREGIMGDHPPRGQTENHSAKSRAHARQAPDGANRIWRKHIRRHGQQIRERARVR